MHFCTKLIHIRTKITYSFYIVFLCSIGLTSCITWIKNPPAGKPYVLETNVHINGNVPKKVKQQLVSELYTQVEDTLKPRFKSWPFFQVMKSPSVFDSAYLGTSKQFMSLMLNTLGYFRDSIDVSTSFKEGKRRSDGQPTTAVTINFHINPGPLTHIDSLSYTLKDSIGSSPNRNNLQLLTNINTVDKGLIKKGDAFNSNIIGAEIDRLAEVYRNNGHLRFGKDLFVALWDTIDVSILQPSMDPFEQLEQLEKRRLRQLNPTANLELKLKSNIDTNRLKKYYVGNITVIPEFNIDTTGIAPKIVWVDSIKVINYNNTFRPEILPENIYLKKGMLYRQRTYQRTLTRISSLGSWRMAYIDALPRANQDTVDFLIKLTPATKYGFNFSVEGSQNSNIVSNNLGVGISTGVQNKNLFRSAILATTGFRYGREFGAIGGIWKNNRSEQISFSQNIYIPRLLPVFGFIPKDLRENFRTVLSLNTAHTRSFGYYGLNTVNASWGYDFRYRNGLTLSLKLPNIEFSRLTPTDSLLRAFDKTPSLRYSFNDGFITSSILSATINRPGDKISSIIKTNIEYSPLIAGLIKNKFLDSNLYRFIKIDGEYARLIHFPRTRLALRFFAGVGHAFNNTVNENKRNNLPFFKQYFSGGPNSMRAWRIRSLGPGSSINSNDKLPFRFGDLQLEMNAEYRFNIGSIIGFKVDGAAFTDIGNIWMLKPAPGRPEDEIFRFSKIGKDIAVGAGAGIRVDFSFIVLRIDYAYKVKDPSPFIEYAHLQNKWFGYKFFKGSTPQFSIGLPFIF